MPDRQPRRMIGRPREPQPSTRRGDLTFQVLFAVFKLAVSITLMAACGLVLVYLLVEYALPVAVDVVLDAVEQRE